VKRFKWGWLAGILGLGAAGVWAENDPAGIAYRLPSSEVISKEKTESQAERKQAARSDLDLEAALREKGYFWVNGRWIKKGEPVVPARSPGELRDSDGDGFDDFTEIKFHTDPLKPESTPASYFRAKGSNQVVFYGTNQTAQKK